ncbi:hypothetical protein PIB30_101605 [Stylosanthes scabra]|uniref:Uncharacterized protein n=1 Tax=Stylosanthes scabra TaxID=79078 RepID=A0ABU6U0G6_9FABA|nr:hypothetical protein [Stylosanthes scabra]
MKIAIQKLSQSTSAFVDQTQNFMQETRANFKNQEASVGNLEIQMGQIAKQLAEKSTKTLPSDTIPNPREECKAITLRSGKQLQEEKTEVSTEAETTQDSPKAKQQKEAPNSSSEISMEKEKVKPYVPKVPFPQRLKKENVDKQFSKFLEVLALI